MKKLVIFMVITLTGATLSAHPLTSHSTDSTHQYLFIVRYNTAAPKLSDDAMKTNIRHWSAWIGQLAQAGKLVTAYRPGNDGQTISGTAKTAKDGPYAGDKAVVSSIFIIKALSLDDAGAIAKANSGAVSSLKATAWNPTKTIGNIFIGPRGRLTSAGPRLCPPLPWISSMAFTSPEPQRSST